MPKEQIYQISTSTLAEVKGLVKNKDYPAAYQAIANDLKAQAAHGVPIDHNTLTWYSDAAQINDPKATSFIHDFVRAYVSDYSELTQNKTIDDAQFQKVSNDLAAEVFREIFADKSIPNFSTVGHADTRKIVTNFGVDQYAWPAFADLASFPWLRNFKNATWLNNLTPVEQYHILVAASQAGESAVVRSRGKGVTPGDIVNTVSLESKLHDAADGLTLHDIMQKGIAIYGAIQRSAASLAGKTPVERLRYYKAQALANAAKKPVPEFMKLHHALMQHVQPQRSFAPIPGRRGQQQGYAPPRPDMEEAGGSAGAAHGALLQGEPLAVGSATAPGEALTGYRAVMAAAKAEAAAAREKRKAEREAMWHPRLRKSVFDRPIAPIGLMGPGDFGQRAAAREGGLLEQYVAMQTSGANDAVVAGRAAGLETAAGELHPRAQPRAGANAGRLAEVAGLEAAYAPPLDMKAALEMYFFRQARLAPVGGAGFDARLTPAWAGVKIPG